MWWGFDWVILSGIEVFESRLEIYGFRVVKSRLADIFVVHPVTSFPNLFSLLQTSTPLILYSSATAVVGTRSVLQLCNSASWWVVGVRKTCCIRPISKFSQSGGCVSYAPVSVLSKMRNVFLE